MSNLELNRTCYKCNNIYPLTDEYFYKNKNKKYGLDYKCKKCTYLQIKQNKATRLSNGICKQCSNIRLPNSNYFCEKCYLKNLSVNHFKTAKYWEILKNKLESQEYKCAFTNDVLILGVNDSLDHKFPISRFPDDYDNMDNLHWTTRTINSMKQNLTDNEFLELITKIYNIAHLRG